jgi:hypothetical protein
VSGLLNAAGQEIRSVPVLSPIDHEGPARDPKWQQELDKIAPPNGKTTTLKLVWVPGEEWAPVGRFVIYQLSPKGVIPFFVNEADLKGPDPRTFGHYDRILGYFVQTRKDLTIDRTQWLLYRETGCYGSPYWVVQGTNGGHLRRFTPTQAALSKLEGGWTEPPAPGDLPFALPDNRTWKALREMDDLTRWEGMVAFHLRAPMMIQEAERAKAEDMRRRMWNQIRGQQEGYWSDEKPVVRAIHEALPVGVGRTSKGPDYEAIEERFITDD